MKRQFPVSPGIRGRSGCSAEPVIDTVENPLGAQTEAGASYPILEAETKVASKPALRPAGYRIALLSIGRE